MTLIVFSFSVLGREDNWDEPAIKVFPVHEELSKLEDPTVPGRELFETRFNVLDGVGRPGATGDSKPTVREGKNVPRFVRTSGPDASSCLDCHSEPVPGGSGGFASNVFVGAHMWNPLTESISSSHTNERNTPSLFGVGIVELLAREMTEDLHAIRDRAIQMAQSEFREVTLQLSTKGVNFGSVIASPDGLYSAKEIFGVDPDLVVKPFGVKGVAVSIREFTNFALNQHHGIQATERFGWQRTGSIDFDNDGVAIEFTVGQVSALTAFQAALPWPKAKNLAVNELGKFNNGAASFNKAECNSCHKTSLPLRSLSFSEPNPFNRSGTAIPSDFDMELKLNFQAQEGSSVALDETSGIQVALFSDLKRHKICDKSTPHYCNEQVEQDFVPTDQFITTRLWDVGSSAPYGHRGDLTTLSEAISNHGGDATRSRDKFFALTDVEKRDVIFFLSHLRSPE